MAGSFLTTLCQSLMNTVAITVHCSKLNSLIICRLLLENDQNYALFYGLQGLLPKKTIDKIGRFSDPFQYWYGRTSVSVHVVTWILHLIY